MRAITTHHMIRRTDGLACQFLNRVQHGVDIRVDHAIEYVPAITTVLNQTGFAQYRKLLRYVLLAKAQIGFHVADTMLAIPEDIENRNPCRVGKNFEYLCLRIQRIDIIFLLFNHIQIHEYDYIPIHFFVNS